MWEFERVLCETLFDLKELALNKLLECLFESVFSLKCNGIDLDVESEEVVTEVELRSEGLVCF